MSETHPAYITKDPALPADYPKPWRCPNGHILGQVVRSNGIRKLTLFWVALNGLANPGIASPLAHATLVGTADVICSICGATRTWFAAEEGMRELLERREQNQESSL